MKNSILILLATIMLFTYSCTKESTDPPVIEDPEQGPVDVEKTNPMKVYVHYMPWFETPTTSDNGAWGIHWTMNTANPDNIDANGKREIAAHYYPAIGPYASSDKDVIEYHLLLMKYAGIDGLIIDWYGSYDLWDYPTNRRNSEAVINKLDEVGLSFALTYEDRTLENIVSNGLAGSVTEAAIEDMAYIESNYFNKNNYIQANDSPLLTVFGPIVLQSEAEWDEVIGSMSEQPTLLSLWNESTEMGSNADGEMAWVLRSNSSLLNFYIHKYATFDYALGAAYPGFVDYYEEGGWGDGMDWSIDHNNGTALEETLQLALDNEVENIQLVTWNDFGEGTMIEPTQEFGYTFIEKIQEFTGTPFDKTAFETITTLYKLRKDKANDDDTQLLLDEAFNALVQLKLEDAQTIIEGIE